MPLCLPCVWRCKLIAPRCSSSSTGQACAGRHEAGLTLLWRATCSGETCGSCWSQGDQFPSWSGLLAARGVCRLAPRHSTRLSGRTDNAASFTLNLRFDCFRAFQITPAAVTSADFDCVFFLSLIETVLVNDCHRTVLEPEASPRDSHKV